MVIQELDLNGLLLAIPQKLRDARGSFCETYRASWYEAYGIDTRFVQENRARSASAGTIRGLHFQRAPFAQAKLIQVLSGAIFDVAVDLRAHSESFGRWAGVTLTAEGAEQLYIPRGFAHGYCTLEANSEVAYKCDNYYSPGHEGGINFLDPGLAVTWPVSADTAIVSDKDRRLPLLEDVAID